MTQEELKVQQEKVEKEKVAREAELKTQAEAKAKAEAEQAGKPVTQEAINTIYKKFRETDEKLQKSEEEKVVLVTRIAELERGRPKPVITQPQSLKDRYNEESFPETEEEWDELIAEHPTYGTDLRQRYLGGISSFEQEQKKSAKKLQDKHPDMFLKDENGNLRYDKNGLVLFDPISEKGKIFNEIAAEDPNILRVKNGPEMVMAAMEARMKGKEEGALKEKIEQEKEEKEKQRQADIKAGRVASGGAQPPQKPNVEVKFNSEAEKQAAERAVASGRVKDLETYCAIRDSKEVSYGRGGF